MNLTFEVYRNRAGQWRWRLRAKNGRLIANAGESYKRRVDCMKAIALVRQSDIANFEVVRA